MKLLSTLLPLLLAAAAAVQADDRIHTEKIPYSGNAANMEGYLAYDDNIEGRRPGVIVVHEWWGQNEYARQRARELAKLGYVALAVDMYGDGRTTEDPEKAAKLAEEVAGDPSALHSRFFAALNVLRGHPKVSPEQTAAVGYCFGGTLLLKLAQGGINLNGIVAFHSNLPTETPPPEGRVVSKVLVLHGEDDSFTDEEELTEFKQQMKDAGADLRVVTYPGAKHSFTNPKADEHAEEHGLDVAYNAAAEEKSWNEMREFLRRLFGQQAAGLERN